MTWVKKWWKRQNIVFNWSNKEITFKRIWNQFKEKERERLRNERDRVILKGLIIVLTQETKVREMLLRDKCLRSSTFIKEKRERKKGGFKRGR